jgi:hypothetical protein
MTRTAKQNGTEAETRVAEFLRPYFPEIRRLAPAGIADTGDLGGIVGLTVQVKAQHQLKLAAWVDQAATQAQRAGTDHYVVVHRRWGKGNPGQWYVTMPLANFAPLYLAVAGAETSA